MRTLRGALTTAAAVALGVSLTMGGSSAFAQSGAAWARYPSGAYGWSNYTPGSSWGNPVTSPTASTAAALTPSTTAQPVVAVRPSNGAGWNAYIASAGRSWTDYAPWTSYDGYTFRAGEDGIYANRVVAIPPSLYRELGTGRPVPLSKPWLPNSE